MDARLAQEGAIQWTIDGHFARRPAALRTNFGPGTGAMPARTPLFAQFTKDTHGGTLLSYHPLMQRAAIYLKVEIDHDEKEQPERLASEICRQVRRVYGVRSAEVSSIVEPES